MSKFVNDAGKSVDNSYQAECAALPWDRGGGRPEVRRRAHT